MNDELISDIYKSQESSSYRQYLESKKIQDLYWKTFIGDFNRLIGRNKNENEEEKRFIGELEEMMQSELFQFLLENDKYCEKVKCIIMKEPLVVGKSRIKLLKIYHELEALCASYKREYESFVKDIEEQIKSDYCKVDAETKNVFEDYLYKNVSKYSFFNTLCNSGIIKSPLASD